MLLRARPFASVIARDRRVLTLPSWPDGPGSIDAGAPARQPRAGARARDRAGHPGRDRHRARRLGDAGISAARVRSAPTSGSAAATGALAPRAKLDRFDGARAWALLREQVEDFGPRPAGSDASRRLAERLRTLLPRGRFQAIPGWPRLRNVVGRIPGTRPAIVIGAHYDTENVIPGHLGANDGAAGTAASSQLARDLARIDRGPDAPELRFVLFDGEEEPEPTADFYRDGLRGSKAYVAKEGSSVRELILLDYIAEKRGLRFPREGGSNADCGTTLRAAARRVGVGRLFPDSTSGAVLDDHTPFTERGIPAIDLIDFALPAARQPAGRPGRGERAQPRRGGRGGAGARAARGYGYCGGRGREAPPRLPARLLRRRRPGGPDRRARARPLRRPCLRPQGDRAQQARRRRAAQARRRVRRRARRDDPRGRHDRLLRPRRVPGGPRGRGAPRPADHRRDVPARHEGPPRGRQVRPRGLHDRPHRPCRPRGGRGDDGRGARPHRARRDRGRRRRARGRGPRPASPTSPRPPCRSTRPARSSPACASASPRSPVPAPTTSATPRRTARRP